VKKSRVKILLNFIQWKKKRQGQDSDLFSFIKRGKKKGMGIGNGKKKRLLFSKGREFRFREESRREKSTGTNLAG